MNEGSRKQLFIEPAQSQNTLSAYPPTASLSWPPLALHKASVSVAAPLPSRPRPCYAIVILPCALFAHSFSESVAASLNVLIVDLYWWSIYLRRFSFDSTR